MRLATFNASAHAAYRIAAPLEAGFNIDLAFIGVRWTP